MAIFQGIAASLVAIIGTGMLAQGIEYKPGKVCWYLLILRKVHQFELYFKTIYKSYCKPLTTNMEQNFEMSNLRVGHMITLSVKFDVEMCLGCTKNCFFLVLV